jgi:hypothetical protein
VKVSCAVHAILTIMVVNTLPKLDKSAFSVIALEQNEEEEKK